MHVAILMATHNGAAYLDEQLASIGAQDHAAWSLWVSDDGSTDATRSIVERFAAGRRPGQVHLVAGPRQGPARNFLSLVERPDIVADGFAFSDQDDVWLPGRLSQSIERLAPFADQVALVGHRTIVVDAGLQPIRQTPLYAAPPSFAHALVQNIAGGNTMLFTDAARRLAARFAPAAQVRAHDWWLYQLIAGVGGTVIYDARPGLLYRQHAGNVFGPYRGAVKYAGRLWQAFTGDYRAWNDGNVAALQAARAALTPENQRLLDAFIALRETRGPKALATLARTPLRRQSHIGNALLALGAALGKL